jgi:hypothetical protein
VRSYHEVVAEVVAAVVGEGTKLEVVGIEGVDHLEVGIRLREGDSHLRFLLLVGTGDGMVVERPFEVGVRDRYLLPLEGRLDVSEVRIQRGQG